MSAHDPCAFCVKLPATNHARSGKVGRCPLCKGLFVEFAAGSYRLLAARGKRSQRGLWAAMIAAGLMLIGGLTLGLLNRDPQPTPAKAMAKADAPAISARAKVSPPPRPEPQRQPQPQVNRESAGGEQPPSPGKPESTEPGAATEAIAPVEQSTDAPVRKVAESPPPPAPKVEPATPASADILPPWPNSPAAEFRQQLIGAPEVLHVDIGPGPRQDVQKQLVNLAKEIQEKNKKEPDAYIRHLRDTRAELSGLPFRLGKDCQLVAGAAKNLGGYSRMIRITLGMTSEASRPRGLPRTNPGGMQPPQTTPLRDPVGGKFWCAWASGKVQNPNGGPERSLPGSDDRKSAWAIPALEQILAAEDSDFRWGLIEHLREIKHPRAAAAQARQALFALEPEVRMAAVAALAERPKEDYSGFLLDGLRYPWTPVAQHAALALVELRRADLLPELVQLLEAPDPADPFETTVDNKKVFQVREVVRINHHRNCLLCHAPGDVRRDPAPGLVPAPGQELPPSTSFAYYSGGSRNGPFVRADITYLRQDFSVMLPVKEQKEFNWPEMQRFDFLVRTRTLTQPEAAQLNQERQRHRELIGPSEHRQAVLYALRRLSGLNLDDDRPESWRRALSAATATPTATADRSWKSPCRQ